MASLFQTHVAKWDGCTRCRLCDGRTHMVFSRGVVPADVVFVGEAPGPNEDSIGAAFVGPAGKKLDEIVAHAFADHGHLRLAFSNIVACFPKEEKEAGINAPPMEAIKACQPRLREFVELCNPRLIVTVGKLSDKWVPPAVEGLFDGRKVKWTSITHPAAILRRPAFQQDAECRKAVVTLRSALEELTCQP